MALKIETERDLVHLLGIALAACMYKGENYEKIVNIASHEYHHYCYDKKDFGSSVYSDLMNLVIT